MRTRTAATGDIAIVGLDITLPGCADQHEVWQFLRGKRISRGSFPAERLAQIGLTASPEQFMEGSYLHAIDAFDHRYFNVSLKSAELMDPNQRLTLLSAAKALHDAGLTDSIRDTNTGVYGSVNTTQQYQYLLLLQEQRLKPDLLGMLNSTISSRINFFYDLKGPSVMTDTACSSSLVSVIQASNDLRNGSIDSAVVVSSNLYVKPGFKADKLVDILASDAKTKTFDDRSTGTSIGEGVCAVILKRREDAERDGDHIYGLIKSYAVNNDGQTMNMSSPNPDAQENLIESAWSPLEDKLGRLAFIEAHGTGTAIGDTIEFESLNYFLSTERLLPQSVALTACKSNFGHLDVASGLFSLIKSTLSLYHGELLPHPDFVIPNDEIEFESSAFYVPDRSRPIGEKALAGISSFGMTGTNAHVVLERYEGEGSAAQRTATYDPSTQLPLQLRSYWYPRESSSFAVKHSLQRLETAQRLSIQFPLQLSDCWEIREHKLGGSHLLVGTSMFELLAQGLDGTDYSLARYDIGSLHILSQLTVQEGAFTIIVELDKHSLRGEVAYSTSQDATIRSWLQFELMDKHVVASLEADWPDTAGMQEIEVTSQIGEGDGADIAVSGRWNVVDRLWIDESKERAVVKLKAPPGYEKEFRQYAFYPAILDPTFNALNRLAVPDQIVFPWHWGGIQIAQTAMQGTEFCADITLKDRTRDDRGNVILSLAIRLYDSERRLVLAADHYKVKNAVASAAAESNAPSPYFKQEQFVPLPAGVRSSGTAVHFIHASRKSAEWELPNGDVTLFYNQLSELSESSYYLTQAVDATHAFVWDRSYGNDEPIAEEAYELGRFMLRLNQELKLEQFHYVTTGLFREAAEAIHPGNRAIASSAYSLRLETSYGVTIIDTDGNTPTESLSGLDLAGEAFVIQRGSKLSTLRFKNAKLDLPTVDKLQDGDQMLIIGGSSGIGKAYATYLSQQYPQLLVIAAGRRPWDGQQLPSNMRYVQLDVTDEAQLSTFAAAERIDYVFNFAGEPASGLFVNKTKEAFVDKTRSKIEGSRYLARHFAAAKEIIHFASLAGLIGAMGQAEYCAANAYQAGQALAEPHVRTLNLTGWEDVGMSAGKSDYYFEKLWSEEGIPMLHQFVQSSLQCAAMFKLAQPADAYSPLFAKGVKQKAAQAHSIEAQPNSPLMNSSQGQQSSPITTSASIEAGVIDAWKKTLGDEVYDDRISFFEQGGDSITIVHLCDELNRTFPGRFDVTTLFSIATIRGQIELLEGALAAEQEQQASKDGAAKQPQAGEKKYDAADMMAFLYQ
ncbi:SDR family NAD(P)-dependent oxidoreductase [Paenibacillus sp. PR3]|uniref:SDR family NAD(P)-dependent oxidoreductase n=1 Tax=Paenibacillus terricola TaxID=2763503 RepID=A0ABR8N0V5_9BACL|nr:SDR family NAD(P)-dependent oxidoreductase [Paenibacillus terricola]MBD3920886.1 SDR family NAD(P)-dependent oxidoreductase [Paenibacillus terricola]